VKGKRDGKGEKRKGEKGEEGRGGIAFS